MDIAKIIHDQWFELRAKGRFDGMLPGARSFRTLTTEGEPWGYETYEHRVRRRVTIPGSGPEGGDGVAGLVETYFSERLKTASSIGWGLNLHVHVVEVDNETVQVAHLAQLVRNVAAIRRALNDISVWENREQGYLHRHAYVHGVLLGRVVSSDVLMASALSERDPCLYCPKISVGCVSVHRTKGVIVERMEPRGKYSTERDGHREEAQRTLDELLGATPLWSEWAHARREEQAAPCTNDRPCPRCRADQREDQHDDDAALH